MKPIHLFAGAFAIALFSGVGGYYFCLHKNDKTASVDSKNPAAPARRSPHRGLSSQRTASALSQGEISQLQEELNREKDAFARYRLVSQKLEAWASADPVSALSWLKSQPASSKREEAIHSAMMEFIEKDAKAAAAWALENQQGTSLKNSLILACGHWASTDGFGAATWASSLPASTERDAALESLFCAWAANSPQGSLSFLAEKPVENKELALTLRQATYAGWAQTDPRGAVESSLESSRKYSEPGQFANTLANWATEDLTNAAQWLLEKQDTINETERKAAIGELNQIFLHESPEKGIAWIDQFKEGAERNQILGEFLTGWADVEPQGAVQWLEKEQGRNLNEDLIETILYDFASSSTEDFEKWRASLPNGKLKNQADIAADHFSKQEN